MLRIMAIDSITNVSEWCCGQEFCRGGLIEGVGKRWVEGAQTQRGLD